MGARSFIPALLGALGIAHSAEPVEVISPRPDSVSVTIYRDFFALVTETRTVDLPAGPVTLSFDGVVETLLPASAVVAETGRELQERNYDYEQLTPGSLFSRSVGQEILLTRTLNRGRKVVQEPATVLAATTDGVVLRTRDGTEALYCSGLPERVSFQEIPDDLQQRPRLSVRLGAGPAGKRTVRVSYLAHGFLWKSDYVARLGERGSHMDLKGWVTLRNLTNTSFRDAQVQVVAGRPHLLFRDDGGTSVIQDTEFYDERALRGAREEWLAETLEEAEEQAQEEAEDYDGHPTLLSGCYPVSEEEIRLRLNLQVTAIARGGGGDEIEEVIVTGLRGSLIGHEPLADYQLYRLPWRTDLQARQTKQVQFLDKPAVKVERFYSRSLDAFRGDEDEMEAPVLRLGFVNRKSAGLGEPLPEGVLRLFEPGPAGDLFSGEGSLNDTSINEPVEVPLAGAVDLVLNIHTESGQRTAKPEGNTIDLASAEILISNAKGVPVTVEIRQSLHEYNANAEVVRASHRTQRKHGDLAWRVRVPANSNHTLSFELRREEILED